MTELVGILNLTPDSFSGDRVNPDEDKYLERVIEEAARLTKAGAGYIDIGAQSTRPGAQQLSTKEEWARLEPILPELKQRYNGRLSLDTFQPEVVRWAAKQADNLIVNDVTGFANPEMKQATAELGLRCIVSHLPHEFGQNIQGAHASTRLIDSLEVVKQQLLERRDELVTAGVHPDNIILDPGIGFGKTPALNRALLQFAGHVPGIPVMIGFSKKRFLGEHRMDKEPNQEAARVAIAAGAHYLRVHNPEWFTNL